jgi:hypothetical protein
MTSIQWIVVAIALTVGLAVGIRGSMPAIFGVMAATLAAWALMSFLEWRRILRLGHGSGQRPVPRRHPDA